jgi:hypothetical protein
VTRDVATETGKVQGSSWYSLLEWIEVAARNGANILDSVEVATRTAKSMPGNWRPILEDAHQIERGILNEIDEALNL